MSYKLNNVNISAFGAFPALVGEKLAISGIFDCPKRKSPTERIWDTEIEPFVDALDIELENGEIVFNSVINPGLNESENLISNSRIDVESNLYGFGYRTVQVEAGQTYTLSVNGNAENALNGKHLRVFIYKEDWSWAFVVPITETTDTTRTVTFSVTETVLLHIQAYYYNDSEPRTGSVKVNWYKLEKGSVATGYSPSQVEVDSLVNSYSQALKNCTVISNDVADFNVICNGPISVEKRGNVFMSAANYLHVFELAELVQEPTNTGAYQLDGYGLESDFGIHILFVKDNYSVPGRIEVATTDTYTLTDYRKNNEMQLECVAKADSFEQLFLSIRQFQALCCAPGFRTFKTPTNTYSVYVTQGWKAKYIGEHLLKFTLKIMCHD